MKAKAFGLLLLLPIAASAQVTYDYTSGPITSITITGGGPPTPNLPLGTDITGVITFASPLPANGTVMVSPVSANFNVSIFQGFGPGVEAVQQYSFTTANGQITSFSFLDRSPYGVSPGEGITASSADNTATYAFGSATGGFTETATAGNFVVAPQNVQGAPEIDPASAGAALTILGGAVVMLRGRRRRVG